MSARCTEGAVPGGGLVLEGVCAWHGSAQVLHGVSACFHPGRLAVVLGPNGAGKSTLLRACLGLHPVVEGEVRLAGRPLRAWGRAGLARQVAWVPQRPGAVEGFTAREWVLMGRTPHLGLLGLTGPADAARADAWLAEVGLPGVGDRPVEALSGGEQRLVLFARALAQEAAGVLLDEPTAFLDVRHQVALLERARGHVRQGGWAVAVLHDVNLAAAWADDVLLLRSGRVVAHGSAAEVLTPALLGELYGVPVVQAEAGGQRLYAAKAG
ncbi:MAG: ABC transporter ATP-binding protein [Deltaproteobacteria bacterium]|nr:ABC transporter ATP-binding protein [Deltaproteobacteria bacterium]